MTGCSPMWAKMGVAHNTINVSKLIPGDDLKIIATYTSEEEIFIFVGAGDTFRSSILGFSLTALQTNIDTGDLSGLMAYF